MNTSDVVIRCGSGKDAEAITALARRSKASWGYPAEWLATWHERLAVHESYLQHADNILSMHRNPAAMLRP
jgi:hypothetical protein